MVVTGSGDRTARVWDAAGGEAVAVLVGHKGEVASVAVGVAGGRAVVVTGSWDRTARVWDAASGEAVAVLAGHEGAVNSVAVGEVEGRAVVATGSDDRTARVWEAAGGVHEPSALVTVPLGYSVTAVAWADLGTLAVATARGVGLLEIKADARPRQALAINQGLGELPGTVTS